MPETTLSRRRRVLAGSTLAAVLAAGTAAGWYLSNGDPAVVETTGGPAAAAQAQARRAAFTTGQSSATADSVAAGLSESLTVDGDAVTSSIMCIDTEWQPSEEELAQANADTDALARTFDTFGVAYQVVTDSYGFRFLEYDWEDVIAEAVSASFWADRYPPEPIPQADLDRAAAEADGLAERFDAAGIAYTRHGDDSGWVWLEWNWEDPVAADVADGYYAELYPPQPLPREELDRIIAENEELAALFDAAGIAYSRHADDLGFEWLEWDWADEQASQIVSDYYLEKYPPVDGCTAGPLPVDPGIGDGATPLPEPAVIDDATGSDPVEPVEAPAVDADVPDEEQIELNAAIAEALTAAGIDFTLAAEDYSAIEWDRTDDAANLAVERAYEEFFGPDPVDLADRLTTVDALAAAFEDAGVAHDVERSDSWAFITFDLNNPAAPGAVAQVRSAR